MRSVLRCLFIIQRCHSALRPVAFTLVHFPFSCPKIFGYVLLYKEQNKGIDFTFWIEVLFTYQCLNNHGMKQAETK